MHALVIGETGQLARALKARAQTGDITATFLNRAACDLSGPAEAIKAAVEPHLSGADVVIIAAAYTAVDAAEDDYDTALAVNGKAPGIIAVAAKNARCPVVHVSTDYVFSGDASTPYTPDLTIDPLNAYGCSKAQGEAAVMAGNPQSAILRTSWVYDGTGKNFLTTMLRLAETRDTLSVVGDQIGRPTYALDLAGACITAAEALFSGKDGAAGIFHVSNSGSAISWAEFAKAIFETARETLAHPITVNAIPSTEYPTPAKRPAYSVMDIASFESVFDIRLPEWQDALHRAFKERST